jgi:hypothetical protein
MGGWSPAPLILDYGFLEDATRSTPSTARSTAPLVAEESGLDSNNINAATSNLSHFVPAITNPD